MREHIVGRSRRLTGYFCGIALGLAFLVAGLEAARVTFLGDLGGAALFGYAAIGLLGGLALSFVAGYLNGGILASWAGGLVPAAARVGPPLADGALREAAVTLLGATGGAVLLGTVGFVVAVEKHRHDSRSADLPDPPSRFALLQLVALALLLGTTLLMLSLFL
jgi:hypothetical protein